jgi:SAM-dependent methyltransferase
MDAKEYALKSMCNPRLGMETTEPLHVMPLIRPYLRGRCIDIGSNDGHNLQLLPEGSTAVDIDISRLSWAKGRYVIIEHDINALPLPFSEGSFDTILMTHVIEHLNAPLPTLKDVHRIIAADGRLIVAVPNAHCLYSDSMKKPYHLYAFSYRTFRSLVEKAGFKIEKVLFNWPKTRSVMFGRLWNTVHRAVPLRGLAPDFWLICRARKGP